MWCLCLAADYEMAVLVLFGKEELAPPSVRPATARGSQRGAEKHEA